MNARSPLVSVACSILASLLAAAPAAAQYSYGGSSGSGSGLRGFVVFVEGGLANPRNTDNVVAVSDVGAFVPVVPDWDDEFTGRFGLGYRWPGGNRLTAGVWNFEALTDASGAGSFVFPVGPEIDNGTSTFGTTGSNFSIETEVNARTADLTWSHDHELTERINLEWSLGLRHATFEETVGGTYGDGSFVYAVAKGNEGTMVGARVGLRALYRLQRFSFGAGLAFSELDGEIESHSSLRPTPASFPASGSALTDDSRSGSIRDLEAVANWHLLQDALVFTLGWERAEWDGIATDLMRNLPGTAELRDRNGVIFSGLKVGVRATF